MATAGPYHGGLQRMAALIGPPTHIRLPKGAGTGMESQPPCRLSMQLHQAQLAQYLRSFPKAEPHPPQLVVKGSQQLSTHEGLGVEGRLCPQHLSRTGSPRQHAGPSDRVLRKLMHPPLARQHHRLGRSRSAFRTRRATQHAAPSTPSPSPPKVTGQCTSGCHGAPQPCRVATQAVPHLVLDLLEQLLHKM